MHRRPVAGAGSSCSPVRSSASASAAPGCSSPVVVPGTVGSTSCFRCNSQGSFAGCYESSSPVGSLVGFGSSSLKVYNSRVVEPRLLGVIVIELIETLLLGIYILGIRSILSITYTPFAHIYYGDQNKDSKYITPKGITIIHYCSIKQFNLIIT